MHSEPAPILNALSFDLEDWFHMMDVPGLDNPASWQEFPSLVERTTLPILETLASAKVKATFFILGWIADQYPKLIRQIAEGGHEIACHAHWHRRLDLLKPEELQEELELATAAITRASGIRPIGFRAPSFSITPGSEWIFDVLLDQGFTYDASLFPAPRDNGGYPSPRPPFGLQTPLGRSLPELPMSVMDLGRLTTAFSGGGFLRLLPLFLIRQGFAQCHRAGRPVVVYLHPRDFAPDGPTIPMPRTKRFKSKVGLRSTMKKLEALLEQYPFAPCSTVLHQLGLLA